MTTIRVAKRRKYTSIDRDTLNNLSLSFRARGVLAWLLDKPDDWQTDAESIANHGKEGRDAIRAALKELAEAGYLIREKRQDDKGQWVHICTIYEVPPQAGFQGLENQDQENQPQDSQALSNELLIPMTDTEREVIPLTSLEDEFSIWWKTYPRKIEKAKALKGYRARRKSGVTAAKLLTACQNYAQATASSDQIFVKHGATFLNGEEGPWSDYVEGIPEAAQSTRSGKPLPLPTHAPEVRALTIAEFGGDE